MIVERAKGSFELLGSMKRFCKLFLLVWFLLHLLLPASAQISAASSTTAPAVRVLLGQSTVALYGPWKFQTGDSPRVAGSGNPLWASPEFDDDHWETVDLTPQARDVDRVFGFAGYVPGWTAKGHPGYWGYAWYRIRVRLNGSNGNTLALQGPAHLDDAYQAFADGRLIGSFGAFRGNKPPVSYFEKPEMFSLPRRLENLDAGPETVLIAFRVWMGPDSLIESSNTYSEVGGLHSAPLLGELDAVRTQYQLSWLELVRFVSSRVIATIMALSVTLLCCTLIFFDRSDAVYVWLAANFLLKTYIFALQAAANLTTLVGGFAYNVQIYVVLLPLTDAGWVIVWWVWFRLERSPWIPRVLTVLVLLEMLSEGLERNFFFASLPHALAWPAQAAALLVRLLFSALLIFIVYRGIQEEGREGWFAMPAVALTALSYLGDESLFWHLLPTLSLFGTVIFIRDIAEAVSVAVMFLLLMRRLLLSIRCRREMALDVEHAQEVQHVLLPERLSVPGLNIETEYRPAREVGGDFFQILPHPLDGSVLIVAGDVAGKGLQAGMLVAVLVGAIHSTVECNPDPQFVLGALNRRLLGRGDAAATCLAMRIEADGQVTLANAGHLAPYLNGIEVEMEGALPLGMIGAADFPISHFQFKAGDTITLISDGILEAQDKTGQLFGFARIGELLCARLNAAALATAAQNFGQQDDISVVSISRFAIAENV